MLAVADGSESVVLQPSRPAALLAALLLNANSVVSVEFLQRVIWGDETPAQGRSALHSCVLRLRRLFAKYGIAGNMIEAVPGGYRLTADAQTLDLVRFRELLGAAYESAGPEEELRLLRAALALWRPPLLANVPSDLLHRDELPKLREEWLRAIERVFDLELECGRHRDALSEIWATAREHPLHERFTAQLMEALARAGRRAEALAEYRRLKSYLARTLGVDPGVALQHLELAILRSELPAARKPGPAPPATAPLATARPDAAVEAVAGDQVLDALVDAGLLAEGPRGRYRVHELLRVFTRAAASSAAASAEPDADTAAEPDADTAAAGPRPARVSPQTGRAGPSASAGPPHAGQSTRVDPGGGAGPEGGRQARPGGDPAAEGPAAGGQGAPQSLTGPEGAPHGQDRTTRRRD